ncbi:hypothetical protein [Bacillus mycoides]|nr:hypothetical protein [Bacillus mycoides]
MICILLFTYGKYNYTFGDFTSAEEGLTVELDILQMTNLLSAG